jgi:hypothetical protein
VDDLVQETYLKLCENNFRPLREFKYDHENGIYGLLKAVACSVFGEYIRYRLSQKRGGGKATVCLEDGTVAQVLVNVAGYLEREVVLHEIDRLLATCSDDATQRDCATFWLYYRYGLTCNAIAGIAYIGLIELARELSLPVIATNGVNYANPVDREILDVFTCIKNKRQLATGGRLLCQNSERYIRTPEQMARMFADIPEAVSNTVDLSSRLQFTLKDLGYKFPSYPVPPGETMDSFLYQRTWEGVRHRYQPMTDRVVSQLDRELSLIEKLGLAGYFLIVWDIVRYCNQNGILARARFGSQGDDRVMLMVARDGIDQHYTPFGIPANGILLNPKSDLTTSVARC